MERIKASLSNVTLSKEKNLMIINGCIAKIGEPSTGAPYGAGGYNICFTQESVDACGKSFVGMPVNCVLPAGMFGDGFDEFYSPEEILSGHGNTIIGFVRKCKAQGDNLMAEIAMWKDKYPWLAELTINTMDSLGFSIEMYPTKVHNDDKNNIQYIDEFEGVGCAMLWSNVAAFSQTFIDKIAAMRSDNNMDEKLKNEIAEQVKASVAESAEQMKASLEETVNSLVESVAAINATLDNIVKAQEEPEQKPESEAPVDEPVKASKETEDAITELKATVEALKASVEKPSIPEPKTGQKAQANPNLEVQSDKAEKIKQINASSMSAMEKLRAIARLNINAN
ncbi:hypothetical protein [Anaerovibrio sp.]|uniref:hypothetical protein n=1 Tax=Anaerovibrio sp. TaxID=1872532 RepID=UPI003F186E49